MSEKISSPDGIHRLGWGAGAVLALLALLTYLPGFFTLPPVDRDEARFIQATRQMVESGDYIDIRFQDQARYKKPIGIYWLQLASVKSWQSVTGADAASAVWPYRLPSLIASVTSVVLTGMIGAVLFGPRVGFIAGLLMTLSLVLNFEARAATTDAMLLATTLAAQYALVRAYAGALGGRTSLPSGLIYFGWLGFAIGILVKGPIIALVLAGTILGLAYAGMGLGWLRRLRPWRGIGLTLLIVMPWLLTITYRSQGTFLNESMAQDLLGKLFDAETAGRLPPGFHALMFWLGFWPGSLIVILALPWIWATRHEPSVRYCLAWIIPTWLLFELPMTKLFHYVLPAYPALAVMGAAWFVAGCKATWGLLLHRTILIVWAILTVAIAMTLIAVPIRLEGRVITYAVPFAFAVCGAMAAPYFLVQRRQYAVLGTMVVSGMALAFGLGLTLPSLNSVFLSRAVAGALPKITGCARTDLVSSGYEEPSLVFLTSTDIKFMFGPQAAEALAASPCTVAIVDGREEPAFLARSAALGTSPTILSRIEGLNYANSRRMSLGIYVQDPRR